MRSSYVYGMYRQGKGIYTLTWKKNHLLNQAARIEGADLLYLYKNLFAFLVGLINVFVIIKLSVTECHLERSLHLLLHGIA